MIKKSVSLIERACISIPEFNELYRKMKRSIDLSGKSKSTLINYARCLSTMAFYFKCNPLELDDEQILDYLHHLTKQSKTPSSSYFKHILYGLRFAYKVEGMEPRLITLPSLKQPKKLPVVLSFNEVKLLLKTPKLLKHRMVLAMLYGCGLRRSELMNIKLVDIDFDRSMLHIREGKGKKDRYVPLGENLIIGLKKYLESERPVTWLFNGKNKEGVLQKFSETGVQWIVRETAKSSGISKHITSHILRHTYATHLLEMGLDIMTLRDLLGHTDIRTTLIYLHVSNLGRGIAFSPMDRLYKIKS